jgi:hypothetical protein
MIANKCRFFGIKRGISRWKQGLRGIAVVLKCLVAAIKYTGIFYQKHIRYQLTCRAWWMARFI